MDDPRGVPAMDERTTKLKAAEVLPLLGVTHLPAGTEFVGRRIVVSSGAVYELGAYVLIEDAFWARRIDEPTFEATGRP
jgi:hypothetical protein